MTTKILGKMIDLMLSSGRKENEIIDYREDDKILREQYSYALRCIKLYFGSRDEK